MPLRAKRSCSGGRKLFHSTIPWASKYDPPYVQPKKDPRSMTHRSVKPETRQTTLRPVVHMYNLPWPWRPITTRRRRSGGVPARTHSCLGRCRHGHPERVPAAVLALGWSGLQRGGRTSRWSRDPLGNRRGAGTTATHIGVSPSLFDKTVKDGRMPGPKLTNRPMLRRA